MYIFEVIAQSFPDRRNSARSAWAAGRIGLQAEVHNF
jgi:hypothetical protein